MINKQRREFIKRGVTATAGLSMASAFPHAFAWPGSSGDMFFKISLAEWSFHKALFANEMTNLEFPGKAKNEFGINAVEYVNQFFKDKAEDSQYLNELKKRCEDNDVTSVLIMIDGEGSLAELDANERNKAVENHYKWVNAAKELGCHSIRVNARGEGSIKDVQQAAVDGLGKLAEYGEKMGIGVIVENHGGYSSNADWLTTVMKKVNNKYLGTLPDFGNFCIKYSVENGERKCEEEYDRYKGVKLMMPYAKGVSAKSYAFDDQGNETTIDYFKMMEIVKDAGYTGHVGIEYEGSGLSEDEGVKATKKLLMRVGEKLS